MKGVVYHWAGFVPTSKSFGYGKLAHQSEKKKNDNQQFTELNAIYIL